jgi:hypothetical protein
MHRPVPLRFVLRVPVPGEYEVEWSRGSLASMHGVSSAGADCGREH